MSQPLMPAQQISLLDIYTKQIEMGEGLKTLKEQLPDHESRIRRLENSRALIIGAASAISILVSAGGT